MTTRHTNSSTMSAFNTTMYARVDPHMAIISINTGSLATFSHTISPDGLVATWVVSEFHLGDVFFSATLVARILNNIVPDYQTVDCHLNISYVSIPVVAYALTGRHYVVNDSVSAATPISQPTINITIPATGTSIASTITPDVTIQEMVTFVVVVLLPESTTRVLVDTTFDSSNRMQIWNVDIALGSQVTCSNGSGPSIINKSHSSGSLVYDIASIDFGSCTNAYDNIVNTQDTIMLTFNVSIYDMPSNFNKAELLTSVNLTYSQTQLNVYNTIGTSYALRVVAPFLLAEKVIAEANKPTDAGDNVRQNCAFFDLTYSGSGCIFVHRSPYRPVAVMGVRPECDHVRRCQYGYLCI